MADLQLNRAKTGVLCMDMHNFTVANVPQSRRPTMLAATRRVLDAARGAGVLVVYVAAARRPEFSSPRNKFTSARPPANPAEAAERTKIVETVAPAQNEPIVRKPRINAFYGSELQSILGARDIDTLVLSGVSTNFVVESTARYAVDADYRVIILEDCCGAASEEEHTRAIASLGPLAQIATSEDFVASLR